MPRVSVVTCTYNRAHLIGETIQSVLDQSFRDFEYIIVDDGSADNTAAVVKGFDDPRIRYFLQPHSGRLSSLRNYSHSKCAGELIAYVDSDDLWDRGKLKKQVGALDAHPAVGFSFTDIELFNDRGVLRKSIYGKSGTFLGNVFRNMLGNSLVICHTTLVIRKSCIDTVGQSDESFHAGDHDFVFRMSSSYDAAVFYEPLVRVRKHDQNTTNNRAYDLMGFQEHHRTLRKLMDQKLISSKEYDEAFQITSYAFGKQLTAVGDHDNALHYFKTSLRLKPWDIRSWVGLILTLAKKVFSF